MYCDDCAMFKWKECGKKPDDMPCQDYVPEDMEGDVYDHRRFG
jgi:hypothetical protein